MSRRPYDPFSPRGNWAEPFTAMPPELDPADDEPTTATDDIPPPVLDAPPLPPPEPPQKPTKAKRVRRPRKTKPEALDEALARLDAEAR